MVLPSDVSHIPGPESPDSGAAALPPAHGRVASPRGSTFHAIVSVMAVKIQFSSPRGVLLSFSRPGILENTKQPQRQKQVMKAEGGGKRRSEGTAHQTRGGGGLAMLGGPLCLTGFLRLLGIQLHILKFSLHFTFFLSPSVQKEQVWPLQHSCVMAGAKQL